jgi:MFS family permease
VTGQRELRDGWPVILSAMLGILMTNIHTYTLGMFIGPLESGFGWSRADITAATAIGSAMGLVLYPAVGAAIDRIGARKLALPGVVFYCAALAGLGLTGPSIHSWWLGYAVLTCGHMMASVSVWTSGVAGRFDTRRGLALGIAFVGGGICSGIMPSLANYLIQAVGWRHAYMMLGAIGLAIALPTAILFFFDARSGRARHSRRTGANIGWQPAGLGAKEGLSTLTFWQLAVATLCLTTGVIGLAVHFPEILGERGIGRTAAAAIVGSVGAASIAGRLGTGFFLDRMHVRFIGSFLYALPALACALLLFGADTSLVAVLAAVSLGFALGAEVDVLSYATTRYFGLRAYGILFGIFAALMSVGAGLGPVLGGLIFDRTHSYHAMLVACAALFLLSALLVLLLRPYLSGVRGDEWTKRDGPEFLEDKL